MAEDSSDSDSLGTSSTSDVPINPLVDGGALLNGVTEEGSVTVSQVFGDGDGVTDVAVFGLEHGPGTGGVLFGITTNLDIDGFSVHASSNTGGEGHWVRDVFNEEFHLDMIKRLLIISF